MSGRPPALYSSPPKMPFPFTFIFSVPGLINPFAANSNIITTSKSRRLAQQQPERYSPVQTSDSSTNLPNTNRPRPPSPSTTSGAGSNSRKRGWQPTFAEPSRSTTTLASTGGYIDIDARLPTRFLKWGQAGAAANIHLSIKMICTLILKKVSVIDMYY